MKLVRYTKAARTWKVQDIPYVHFGIGQATSVDSVVIRWPLGDVEVFTDLAINQYNKIVELGDTGVEIKDAINKETPTSFDLDQNYPNPFNPETMIAYELPKESHVLLKVFNLAGQKVKTLVNEQQHAGRQEVTWTGMDAVNNALPSGVYLYRLQVNDRFLTKKMMFVR